MLVLLVDLGDFAPSPNTKKIATLIKHFRSFCWYIWIFVVTCKPINKAIKVDQPYEVPTKIKKAIAVLECENLVLVFCSLRVV